jgi:hypothetical protein
MHLPTISFKYLPAQAHFTSREFNMSNEGRLHRHLNSIRSVMALANLANILTYYVRSFPWLIFSLTAYFYTSVLQCK